MCKGVTVEVIGENIAVSFDEFSILIIEGLKSHFCRDGNNETCRGLLISIQTTKKESNFAFMCLENFSALVEKSLPMSALGAENVPAVFQILIDRC